MYEADYAANAANLQIGDILVASTYAVVAVSGAKEPSNADGVGGAGAASSFTDVGELARAVITGRYGNGDARRIALGSKYDVVQKRVNEMLTGTSTPLEPPLALRGSSPVLTRLWQASSMFAASRALAARRLRAMFAVSTSTALD